MLTYLIYLRDI